MTEEKTYNIVEGLNAFKQHAPLLAKITLGGMVLAFVFSLFTKDYFSSTIVCYPANPELAVPEKIFGENNTISKYYGDGDDLDRIITVFYSENVLKHLLQQHNLYAHYKIDANHVKAFSRLQKYFSKHVTLKKTKYNAIEIRVEDTDPIFAKTLCDAVFLEIKLGLQQTIKSSLQEMLHAIKHSLEIKDKEMKGLVDSMKHIRQQGFVYSPYKQADLISDQITGVYLKLAYEKERLQILRSDPAVRRDTVAMVRAIVHGLEKQIAYLKNNTNEDGFTIAKYNANREPSIILDKLFVEMAEQAAFERVREQKLESLLASDFTCLQIVQSAEIANVKSRPQRLYITGIAGLLCLFFGTFFILLFKPT